MKFLLIYLCICISFFSMNIVSSNGSIGIGYDISKKVINNVHLGLDPSKIDIDSIELGFATRDKIYRLKDYEVEVKPINGTNIFLLKALIEDSYKYEAFVYASMVNKDRLVIEASVEDVDGRMLDDIRFFYYLKPSKEYRNVVGYDFYYSYNNIYMKSVGEVSDLAFTNDEMLQEQKFIPFSGDGIKEKDLALFFIEQKPNNSNKNVFVMSWNNFNFALNMVSHIDEQNYWNEYLVDIENQQAREAFAILKSYQRRDGSIYNFNKNKGLVYVDDMISAVNSFMDFGFFEDAKRALRYLINSKSGMKKNSYMISNYAYDFDRKEVFKKDKYGDMLNIINSAEFLNAFCRYYNLSGDKKFIEENINEVEAKVAEYLLLMVDDYGVKENSGRYKTGIGRGRRFFESQTAVYDAFTKFIGVLDLLGRDNAFYVDAILKIKKNVNNYVVDDELLSYPKGSMALDRDDHNLYGIHKDYFDEEKLEKIIENEFLKIDRFKDRTVLEQAEFINFLYEFAYEETGSGMKASLIGKLGRSDVYAACEMQNSVEFIYEYLTLLKKE